MVDPSTTVLLDDLFLPLGMRAVVDRVVHAELASDSVEFFVRARSRDHSATRRERDLGRVDRDASGPEDEDGLTRLERRARVTVQAMPRRDPLRNPPKKPGQPTSVSSGGSDLAETRR